jgi:hypothetical protein
VKREVTRGHEQARLPPRERLWLHGDGASAFWSPTPLTTPPLHRRQQQRDWGGIPERLGFGVGGCNDSYIGGGRWVGRHDRAPDAWRLSTVAGMAARPLPFNGSARE